MHGPFARIDELIEAEGISVGLLGRIGAIDRLQVENQALTDSLFPVPSVL
ncbi:hypothetical protein [Streptomyces hiroshimensis]|uniref:Uncharacterized protein n=1 Tax=Streptomyces hiroshimensis TaxID=66424 RepID=A0ABQ2Y907_9ACTN|nr:hypothetical protein [Streptomyces hiroshimensis]GGX76241.1 hypothetical protein GCM10010324_22360 [Streptomyces hiroshimensis]